MRILAVSNDLSVLPELNGVVDYPFSLEELTKILKGNEAAFGRQEK